jgi:hypothetical protein
MTKAVCTACRFLYTKNKGLKHKEVSIIVTFIEVLGLNHVPNGIRPPFYFYFKHQATQTSRIDHVAHIGQLRA